MYKRILVASGGGPWSDAAVTYAMSLTAEQAQHFEVCLMHVDSVRSRRGRTEGFVE